MSETSASLKPGQPDASPANRLRLDYRDVPPRKTTGPLVDVHTHLKAGDEARLFLEVAEAYGVGHVVTMAPLEHLPALRAAYPGRLSFIAIPNWRQMDRSPEFSRTWISDLGEFRELGARLCKFWVAPLLRGMYGLTLDHEFFTPVIERALELDFDFMVHVGDPALWFEPGARYADSAKYGTRRQQFDQLAWFLERVAPRVVIGAHMGGSVEDLDFLQELLDRYPNYHLDSSATKWIVREVATQPERAREFMILNQVRVLFGTDLVTDPQHSFDHYASRYWAHLKLWETPYRGESSIDDPDAPDPPMLNGLDLPVETLDRIYRGNAERLGLVSSSGG